MSCHTAFYLQFDEREVDSLFILPGYVEYYEDNGVIYVSSNLRMNKVKLTDPEIIDEFRAIVRCGGCPEISTPLGQFLHDQELLINEQEVSQAIEELRSYVNDSLLLTIMPTEGCNFRCPYCYEDHAPITMRRTVLDEIQKYIAAQAGNFRHISIGWFGGEPTLCKDVVLETCTLVKELQRKYIFQYSSSMTTNGYLLNVDDFERYYNGGITFFQITLDGWNHDKTRPHVTGKGTLQKILDNLIAISSLPHDQFQYKIVIRHNILPGDEDYSWYDYLKRTFGNDKRFSVLIRPVSDWGGNSIHTLDILKGEALDSHLHKHVEYLKKIAMNCENENKNLLSQICYASYPNSMVFRANGKIEKCTICLDHPKNQLGHVDQELGIVLNDEINQLWSGTMLKPECYQCKDVLSCLNMHCKMPYIINGVDSSKCPHSS